MTDFVQAELQIEALHEPGTLSRIIEFFVLRNIELDSVAATRKGDGRQTVHLSTSATDANEASVIAAKIEQIVTVLSVSLCTQVYGSITTIMAPENKSIASQSTK